MTTDLIKKEITPSEVFKPGGLDLILSGIKEKVDVFMGEAQGFDINDEKDRKKISSFAYQIARSKTFVDDKGKDFVGELKKQTKQIDTERKKFRDTLDQHRDMVKAPVVAWQAEEDKRVEAERMHEIMLLEWDEAIAENDLFNREREMARKEAEFAKVAAALLAKEQAEQAEKDRLANEDRIKKEAAEKAQRDAEAKIQAEKDAKEQAERDRIQAEDDAKEAAAQAERDKVAAKKQAEEDQAAAVQKAKDDAAEQARLEQARKDQQAADEKAEADRKAANRNHQKGVNRKALAALVELGVDKGVAQFVLESIIQCKIPAVSIKY